MSKLVSIEAKRKPIEEDVRKSVIDALDAGYPFVMVFRRPEGVWARSTWIPGDSPASIYEAVGALEDEKLNLLNSLERPEGE